MKKILLTWFLSIVALACVRAQVVKDYSDEIKSQGFASWFGTESYLELGLDLKSFPMANMELDIPEGTVVFVEEEVWFQAEKDTNLFVSLNQLKNTFDSDSVNFLFSGDVFLREQLQVRKVLTRSESQLEVESGSSPQARPHSRGSAVNNVFFVGLLGILLLMALYRIAYPFLFATLTRPISLLNAEDFSQSGSLQKFFSLDSLLYLMLFSLSLGMIGMVTLAVFREAWTEKWIGFGFWNLTSLWMILGLSIFIISIAKFLLIRMIAFLFDIAKIAFAHYFYLLRVLAVSCAVSLIAIAYFLSNDYARVADALDILLQGIFWFYLLGTTALLLIMVNRFSLKKYHLFTYLCIAEMVPFLILVKMILNWGQF